MNWQERGRRDAESGLSTPRVAGYRADCSRFGIEIDEASYQKGIEQGLRNFCNYAKGYEMGHNGRNYSGSCPSELEGDFMRGYKLGRREYDLEARERAVELKEAQLRAQETAVPSSFLRSLQTVRSCSFDSDCTIADHCTFSKCGLTGKACTFSSECEIRGSCQTIRKLEGDNVVSAQLCKFNR